MPAKKPRRIQPNWRACAVRLSAAIPLSELHPSSLAHAGSRAAAGPWAMAVSGGADSVALALLLWGHFPADRRRMVLLHFNHRLRGRAADTDAVFCMRLARSLGIRSAVGEWKRRPADPGEAEARLARHEFFARDMKRLKSRTLWLAHQQDDVAESMLMRLARGSGTAGLAAPRAIQQVDGRWHVRPLLGLSKDRICSALTETGATWREDATNVTSRFFRNRVRSAVIPAWQRAAGRNAVAGAALARERLQEDDEALEQWLAQHRPLSGRILSVSRLKGLPMALWRRALHHWLAVVRPETDLSRRGFDALLAVLRSGRDSRFSLGAKGFAILKRGSLSFKKS
ncbi:MAG TPA: tRNA lysidine(34) synthetase TilS [Candidatus Didemnitutus sp.]|nr:tRNA lysidine(34) synthetase TilS [Candidatus Didemnitutus sp.]